MKSRQISRFIGLSAAAALSCAPFALAQAQDAKPADLQAKRAELRKMCDQALATLYKAKPDAKATVQKAAGYGCFTSFGMSFFVGGAGGKGLVHSNATKTDTFMNMGQAGGGFDFGVKQYREVLVFKDAKTLDQFINKGWEFGGTATAAAAAGGKGGSADDTQISGGAIQVFAVTNTGLAAGVSAAGRKYWKDDELNAAK
jgi:lipid-binding SYLF domain-containing protein